MVTITSEINYMSIHIPATDSIDTLIKAVAAASVFYAITPM